MENSLFKQLEELAKKYYNGPVLTKVSSQTYYQHKENETDRFINPDEFINRKLNGADYEKVVILSSPKDSFLKEFFNNDEYKITKDVIHSMHVVKLILAGTGLISPLAVNPEQVNLPYSSQKKTLFNKKITSLNAKLQKAKGTPEEQAIRLERVNYYIQEGVEPRDTFKDIELYKKEKKKKSNTSNKG